MMQLFGKPKNQWGYVRWGGWALLVVMLALFAWAAAAGASGLSTRAATFLIPVGLVLIGAWLEVQEAKRRVELANSLDEKHRVEVRQSDSLERFREQITALQHDPAGSQLRMNGAVHEVLAGLDGAGKAEVLVILHSAGLLNGASGIDLKGADFCSLKLTEASLAEIHLDGANLQQADLRKCDLSVASLVGCNLRRARLDDAVLAAADLTGATLRNTHLDRANLTGATASAEALDQAVLVDTISPDGVKTTNERGRDYLRKKEMDYVVARL